MENNTQPGVTVLYFYTDWCPVCQSYQPYYKMVMATMESVVTERSINTDHDKQTTGQYNITSVPTTIILKDGVEKERLLGEISINNLKNMIKSYL